VPTLQAHHGTDVYSGLMTANHDSLLLMVFIIGLPIVSRNSARWHSLRAKVTLLCHFEGRVVFLAFDSIYSPLEMLSTLDLDDKRFLIPDLHVCRSTMANTRQKAVVCSGMDLFIAFSYTGDCATFEI
jgi:hypothetical protein